MNQISVKESLLNFIEANKKKFIDASPNTLKIERMIQLMNYELSTNDRLRECSMSSIAGALLRCVMLDLEPDPNLGFVYFIPYKTECTFVLGYKGMLQLCYRSNRIKNVYSEVVYDNDEFEYSLGTKRFINHRRGYGDRGEICAVYAIAELTNGSHAQEILFDDEIRHIRKSSKTAKFWEAHPAEMYRKTAIRRLFKYLPISLKAQQAAYYDEMAELGLQNNALLIEDPNKKPPRVEQVLTDIKMKLEPKKTDIEEEKMKYEQEFNEMHAQKNIEDDGA